MPHSNPSLFGRRAVNAGRRARGIARLHSVLPVALVAVLLLLHASDGGRRPASPLRPVGADITVDPEPVPLLRAAPAQQPLRVAPMRAAWLRLSPVFCLRYAQSENLASADSAGWVPQ